MSCKKVDRLNLWHRFLIALGILKRIDNGQPPTLHIVHRLVRRLYGAAGDPCGLCLKWCIERGCQGSCYCNIYTGSCLCS